MKRLALGVIIGGVLVSHAPQYLSFNPGFFSQIVQQVGSAGVGLVSQAVNAIHR